MKLYELMKYLKEEGAVSGFDIRKMAEALDLGWIGMVSFMGTYSGDRASFSIFKLNDEQKWCLTETGLELLQLFEQAELYVK